MAPQLFLDIDLRALAVRVLFNEIVVLDAAGNEPTRAATRLGGWATSGTNRLVIEWKPPAPGTASGERKLVVRARRIEGEAETVLAQYEWDPAGPPLGQASLGLAFDPPERWRWLEAQAFPALPANERSAILALLEQLRDALAAGDSDRLVAAQTLQLSEQARAAGMTPLEMIGSYRAFLAERLPGSVVEPLEVPTLHLE